MNHFKDCPTQRNYSVCTCNMCGEDIALVEWQIKKQEGKLKWWQWIAWLSTMNVPEIK